MSTLGLVAQISDTVEVVEVRTAGVSQFEIRCSQCAHVDIWEHERHALLNARMHVCASDVHGRLNAVWRSALDHPFFKAGDGSAAMYSEVVKILAEHDLEVGFEQQRSLRWVCGYEVETVANLVELMVAGRES